VDYIAVPLSISLIQGRLWSRILLACIIFSVQKKPIWVTELGAVDTRAWGIGMSKVPTETQAVAAMKRVSSMRRASVHRQIRMVHRQLLGDGTISEPAHFITARGRLDLGRAFAYRSMTGVMTSSLATQSRSESLRHLHINTFEQSRCSPL